MKKLLTALALATLFVSSPALAHPRHHPAHTRHYPGFVALPGAQTWNQLEPAGDTWHDYARWGQPPMPTHTYARSQDGERYHHVDSYDVVLNGQVVGRDPDPNIRFQLLREASNPP
jgi:hypothetical protein